MKEKTTAPSRGKKNAKAQVDVETKPTKESLPYHFTEAEKLEILKELSDQQLALRQTQDDAKREASRWKAKTDEIAARIAQLSNNGSTGYEYRDTKCTITINDPVGKKTCRRDDTGETVEVRHMESMEMQEELQFEEQSKAEPPE